MKILNHLLGVGLMATAVAQAQQDVYSLTAKSIDGKDVPLASYKGKVALIVNTASECGYTPQYKDLEALYQKFKERGLVVLGFPSNDFGKQEPGSDAEIKKFCELKYRVTFPMFTKAPVSGKEKQALYKVLTQETGGGEVEWNFEKFLVDKHGKVVGRYKSKVSPTSTEIEKKIQSLL